MEKVKEEGDEALYNKLDSAYSTDDDNSEVLLSHCAIKVYDTAFHFIFVS